MKKRVLTFVGVELAIVLGYGLRRDSGDLRLHRDARVAFHIQIHLEFDSKKNEVVRCFLVRCCPLESVVKCYVVRFM